MTEEDKTYEVTLNDGEPCDYTEQELYKRLLIGGRVTAVAVSSKEGRQRQQFIGADKFLSMTLSFETDWAFIDAQRDPETRAKAEGFMPFVIVQRIMETDEVIHLCIQHAHKKDGQVYYPRKDDAAVKAGSDVWGFGASIGTKVGAGFRRQVLEAKLVQ